ncbi:MAG TPA: thioesterase domain-containing protein [Steroidobacteraceae bacterium]|nr:thioesterase domain-containing protein [Steroidobacteraceae bacterium]
MEQDIEQYLHRHIPLSAAMGVRVRAASPERVELAAPLAPNINHHETLFGGSGAAIATLSAWTLAHVRLRHAGVRARLVIQRNAMSYDEPIDGDFVAVCEQPHPDEWARFMKMLERRNRGRVTLTARLLYAGRPAASFEGDFVALKD